MFLSSEGRGGGGGGIDDGWFIIKRKVRNFQVVDLPEETQYNISKDHVMPNLVVIIGFL